MVVVSTTGEGDSPDNVTRFWRRLKKKTLPGDHLSSCNYALLGKSVISLLCSTCAWCVVYSRLLVHLQGIGQ